MTNTQLPRSGGENFPSPRAPNPSADFWSANRAYGSCCARSMQYILLLHTLRIKCTPCLPSYDIFNVKETIIIIISFRHVSAFRFIFVAVAALVISRTAFPPYLYTSYAARSFHWQYNESETPSAGNPLAIFPWLRSLPSPQRSFLIFKLESKGLL